MSRPKAAKNLGVSVQQINKRIKDPKDKSAAYKEIDDMPDGIREWLDPNHYLIITQKQYVKFLGSSKVTLRNGDYYIKHRKFKMWVSGYHGAIMELDPVIKVIKDDGSYMGEEEMDVVLNEVIQWPDAYVEPKKPTERVIDHVANRARIKAVINQQMESV